MCAQRWSWNVRQADLRMEVVEGEGARAAWRARSYGGRLGWIIRR
jgi:hypothetical protein